MDKVEFKSGDWVLYVNYAMGDYHLGKIESTNPNNRWIVIDTLSSDHKLITRFYHAVKKLSEEEAMLWMLES